MKLYHGSNQIIRQPDLSKGRRFLDFGNGFYLSDEQRQVENRAKFAVKFLNTGLPTINVYEFDNKKTANLAILSFSTADIEWLDFVIKNRRGEKINTVYDIVIGPTADDNTILLIDQYMSGLFNHLPHPKMTVLELLQPEKLATQYLFATSKSLEYLHHHEHYYLL
jgi:hypothetical protein